MDMAGLINFLVFLSSNSVHAPTVRFLDAFPYRNLTLVVDCKHYFWSIWNMSRWAGPRQFRDILGLIAYTAIFPFSTASLLRPVQSLATNLDATNPHSIEFFKRDLYPTIFPKQVKYRCLKGGGQRIITRCMFWEFFFILQIGIKIASTVPCFKPGNQKKHTKPTRPVKKYLLEGGLQKKTNKTTVDGPPLPGEDQWRALESWHVWFYFYFLMGSWRCPQEETSIVMGYIIGIYNGTIYIHNQLKTMIWVCLFLFKEKSRLMVWHVPYQNCRIFGYPLLTTPWQSQIRHIYDMRINDYVCNVDHYH